LGGGLGERGGGEGVVLGVAVLGEDEGAGALHEGCLGGVGLHRLEPDREDGGYVESDGPGRGDVAETAFDEEVGGEVVEALRGVELAESGEALGRAGPVEGRGGYRGGDGVVGVGVDGAVAAEGDDDVGAEDADALDEVAGEVGEAGELELAVLVIEDFVVADAEEFAGGGEFGAAKLAKLGCGLSGAVIGAGAAVGDADEAGFDAALGGLGESAAKGKALIVGMRSDAEKSECHRKSSGRLDAAGYPTDRWLDGFDGGVEGV
jgi:hypothetical protein